MNCLDIGTLQAYLDRELTAAQVSAAAAHLEDCEPCRRRLAGLEATMGRVDAWLDALAPEDFAVAARPVRRVPARWMAIAAALLLAAALTFLLARRTAPPAPAPVPVLAKTGTLPEPVPTPPAVARVRRRHPLRTKPAPPQDDFVAFDGAEPMQMGVVVRVMLPVSEAQLVAADLVVGEDGRPRAIRLVR